MDFSRYQNKLEYPGFTGWTREMRQEMREKYAEEENRLKDLFKLDFFEEHGIMDHPKKERFFELCWDYGHSGGFEEVYNYSLEWIDLLK